MEEFEQMEWLLTKLYVIQKDVLGKSIWILSYN